MFKVKRTTAFWCLRSWIWTDFIHSSGISKVGFEKLNADRLSIVILLSNRTVFLENANNINIILLKNIFGRTAKSLHKRHFQRFPEKHVKECFHILLLIATIFLSVIVSSHVDFPKPQSTVTRDHSFSTYPKFSKN